MRGTLRSMPSGWRSLEVRDFVFNLFSIIEGLKCRVGNRESIFGGRE